jgi:hypothetical protein
VFSHHPYFIGEHVTQVWPIRGKHSLSHSKRMRDLLSTLGQLDNHTQRGASWPSFTQDARQETGQQGAPDACLQRVSTLQAWGQVFGPQVSNGTRHIHSPWGLKLLAVALGQSFWRSQ